MPMINVIDPGLQTTVQDLGRPMHQINGFPASGAMDQQALQTANLLVGNSPYAAALEFSLTGPTLRFMATTFIALTGAEFNAQLNDQPIKGYRCLQVHMGDVLKIGPAIKGRIGYLAIAGGLHLPLVLDSRSTTLRLKLGGLNGRALVSGDRLPIESRPTMVSYYHRHATAPELPDAGKPTVIRVLKGPQWDQFDDADHERFLTETYTVTNQSDRMGYRLQGATIQTKQESMLSAATVMGGLQVPANGEPIALMADRQTTGGYPLLAVVITADLSKLVQCRPKQQIRFELIELDAAQELLKQQQAGLKQLHHRIKMARYQMPYGITREASQRIQRLFKG